MPKPDLRAEIRGRALTEGFDVVRFTPANAAAEAGTHLETFLREERHGNMDWMAKNADRRADPKTLWPEAKTAIVLGMNYGPRNGYHDTLVSPERAAISVYAQGDDYHDVIKTKLKRLGGFIAETYGADVKVFVDTAPVMEKPLAQAAGAGWQGKHTNLVSRLYGSWLFLGSVFTTLEIGADEAESDHCGGCHRCLDVCPTNAFTAPYEIDARRCISYLTIEHKGHIAEEFRVPMGNRIYGCDDCLAVCPWNKFASLARETKLHARAELSRPRLADLARLDDTQFREVFRGSPIKRIGRDRFVRNVLIAIGNSADISLAHEAERLLSDPSPLVRAMAVWALSKLLDAQHFDALTQAHAPLEQDEGVAHEWRGAIARRQAR
ncbi:MAG TPA: tRNA epoxyqueuosine(34) reductase QueG [Rhizomicrobium sp.]|jgi:epoxyqueuosine reductase|nr:tRNA epoxyqueuosine(34) reductase QueG [Rhizomicrobium sp.]